MTLLSKEHLSAMQELQAAGRQLQTAVRLFTATGPSKRTEESIKECALFLGQVAALGATPPKMGALEDAYWALIDSPSLTREWESTPLFKKDVRAVDREAVDNVLRALLLDNKVMRETADELTALVEGAETAAYSNNIEDGVRAGVSKSVAIGPLVRAAGFIALAMKSGVDSDNRRDLRALVLAKVLPADVKIFTAGVNARAGEDEIRRQLGLSAEQWMAAEKIDTFSAAAPARGVSVDEDVRKQLGISREMWDRHND